MVEFNPSGKNAIVALESARVKYSSAFKPVSKISGDSSWVTGGFLLNRIDSIVEERCDVASHSPAGPPSKGIINKIGCYSCTIFEFSAENAKIADWVADGAV